MDIIIIGLSILFFLGHALSWFFVKTKIPDLLILIIIGFILGPTVTGVIQPDIHLGQAGKVLSIITLIIILYEGGLHLSFKDLMESSLSALSLSLLTFFSITAITAIALFPVLPLMSALLVGVGIGSTSSAIVIPMVKPLSINKQTKTVLSLESAFTDVLTIVIFLGLLEYLTSEDSSGGQFFISLSSTPIMSVGIGVLAGIVWAFLRKKTEVSRLPFAGEAGALLTYGILEFLSLNGAIGVLSLGFTLANINLLPPALKTLLEDKPVSSDELAILSAVTFLLRTFFFLYLGLLIQIKGMSSVLWAICLTSLIFITRYFSIRTVFKSNTFSKLDAITATAMGPRGLACAVLATLPLQRGLEQGEWIQNLVFAVIPLSILITSLFVSLAEKDWFKKKIHTLFKSYSENESNILM
ncbi:MAG: cation:proton antiporter [Bdellovibrionales bacterium]|nr:cation:proton antiporter [Bdellovibrionales bacterium]